MARQALAFWPSAMGLGWSLAVLADSPTQLMAWRTVAYACAWVVLQAWVIHLAGRATTRSLVSATMVTCVILMALTTPHRLRLC